MVESPCTYECYLVDDKCIRCHRDVEEIKNWTKLTDEQRKDIIQRCSEFL